MLAFMSIICVIATAAFLYMSGLRGQKFGLTLCGAVFVIFAVIGAMAPDKPKPQLPKPQLAACSDGYSRGPTGKGECSLTCDAFKTRAPTSSEARYYAYCQEYALESMRVGAGIGKGDWDRSMRSLENLIEETADRERGLSERDVTLRKIERNLRDR